MPKPVAFNVYYDMLLEQLMGERDFPIEINDELLDAAARQVVERVTALGPDRNNLEGDYNEITARRPGAFDDTRPFSDTIGPDNESRYDYSQRCLQEVMLGVKRSVRQTVEWRNAGVRVGVPPENGKAGKIGTRWMFFLMKTDGSAESRAYNEAVAALGALGRGLITADQYLKLRSDYHQQHDNMSADQAAVAAKADMDNGGQFLFDEVKTLVEADRGRVARFKEAALAIQSGDLSAFPGGLHEAYGLFYTAGCHLSQMGGEIIDFLRENLNFQYTDEQQRATNLDWLDISFDVKDMDVIAEQVSNPYFALFDPFRCNYNTIDNAIDVVSPDVKTRNDFMLSFMAATMSIDTQRGREIDALIKRYGVDCSQEIAEERTNSYRVFSRDGRTIILSVGDRTADSFMSIHLADPSYYALRGLDMRVGQLLGQCAGWSRTSHTSPQFEAVREQLEYIHTLDLNTDKPHTEAQLSAASAAFTTLLTLIEDYYEHKKEHHTGSAFEGQRREFMQSVQHFAEQRQRRLNLAAEHIHTVEALRLAELADGENPAWKNDPRYAGMSAVQHNIAVELEQADARREAEREEAARLRDEAKRPMREAREAMRLADGEHNAVAYDALLASCKGATLSHEKASILTETFITDARDAYRAEMQRVTEGRAAHTAEGTGQAETAEQAAFAAAKRMVAGYAIAEILGIEDSRERDQGRPGVAPEVVKTPIRTIVSNGNVDKLADIISSSAFFTEQYALKMSDPQSMQELIDGRANPGGPVRYNAFHAGQAFMENMQFAKEHAPAAGQPKAEQPKAEQPKAEDKKAEQPKVEDKKVEDEKFDFSAALEGLEADIAKREEKVRAGLNIDLKDTFNEILRESEKKKEPKLKNKKKDTSERELKENAAQLNPDNDFFAFSVSGALKDKEQNIDDGFIAEPKKKKNKKKNKNRNKPAAEEIFDFSAGLKEAEAALKGEARKPEKKTEDAKISDDAPFNFGPTQAQGSVKTTIKRVAADPYTMAVKRVNGAIRLRRAKLTEDTPAKQRTMIGRELLALSTVKNMLALASKSNLPSIVNSPRCGELVRSVMNSHEMQQDARGINPGDPEQVKQALDNNFGRRAAYAALAALAGSNAPTGSQKNGKTENVKVKKDLPGNNGLQKK